MNELHYLLLGWLVTSTTFIRAIEIQRMYTERTDSVHGKNITTKDCSSIIDCGRQCAKTIECKRFAFNNNQKMCYMSRGTLLSSQAGGETFGRYCPVHLGYEEVPIGPRRCCIKINYTKMAYTDADKMCWSEGAHIFTVEGLFDVEYLNNTCTGPANACKYFWIDGGASMTTWNAKPMPWTSWAHAIWPRSGECPWIDPQMGTMMSYPCNWPSIYSACQIDL